MTNIWHNAGGKWATLPSVTYKDEAALHDLVHDAPHLLPLAGSPRLAILGREVALGSGRADLIAVERSGRLVIVEVKLAQNAEARRAVVAQVLTYAAWLHRRSRQDLELTLAQHLKKLGHATIADAAKTSDEDGTFDADDFHAALDANLADGQFRFVLVLDAAPPELVRLVGYVAKVGRLTIDLVTVAAYDVNGSRVLVPQRIDADDRDNDPVRGPLPPNARTNKGTYVDGAASFASTIEKAPETARPLLKKLHAWAVALEADGAARLTSYHGKSRSLLLVHVPDEAAGFVTIWNENGGSLQVWRSVFERLAPDSVGTVEQILGGAKLGQGNNVKLISDELLAAIAGAYRVASS